jgi:hypothetical protein
MGTSNTLAGEEPCVTTGVRLPASIYQRVLCLARDRGARTLGPLLRELVLDGLTVMESAENADKQPVSATEPDGDAIPAGNGYQQ